MGKRVPWPRRDRAVGEVAGEVVADRCERGLVQGDVDDPSGAGLRALEQRGEDPERGPRPRALVDERRADAHAGAAGLARHRDQAARGLHQGVVARLLPQRPDVAVGADRAVDESRVAFPQFVRLRGRADPRAPDAGSGGRRRRRLASRSTTSRPAGSRERARERALRRVHGEEHRALVAPEGRAPRAGVVAGVRALHLDDVGAERAEDLGAVRAGDRRRHVEDAQSREGGEGHLLIFAFDASARMGRCSSRSSTPSPAPTGAT